MEYTYFVSWIVTNGAMQIGNCTITTSNTGRELVKEVIEEVTKLVSGAVVLGITKV